MYYNIDDAFLRHADIQLDKSDESWRNKETEVTYMILNIISKRINIEVSPDMRYAELQIDSLVFMTIVLDLEKEFEIAIHNDELEKFKTVQDTIAYVKKILHSRVSV